MDRLCGGQASSLADSYALRISLKGQVEAGSPGRLVVGHLLRDLLAQCWRSEHRDPDRHQRCERRDDEACVREPLEEARACRGYGKSGQLVGDHRAGQQESCDREAEVVGIPGYKAQSPQQGDVEERALE